jgi:hypothetical protein
MKYEIEMIARIPGECEKNVEEFESLDRKNVLARAKELAEKWFLQISKLYPLGSKGCGFRVYDDEGYEIYRGAI